AAALHSRDEGQRRLELVAPLAHEEAGKVQGGGAHRDEQLAGPRRADGDPARRHAGELRREPLADEGGGIALALVNVPRRHRAMLPRPRGSGGGARYHAGAPPSGSSPPRCTPSFDWRSCWPSSPLPAAARSSPWPTPRSPWPPPPSRSPPKGSARSPMRSSPTATTRTTERAARDVQGQSIRATTGRWSDATRAAGLRCARTSTSRSTGCIQILSRASSG